LMLSVPGGASPQGANAEGTRPRITPEGG